MIASPPTVTPAPPAFGSRNTAVVEISAQQLGNVSTSGQYVPAEAGRHQLNQEFTLQQVNGQWRIATLPTRKSSAGVDQPSHELLLTKDLFQLAFQPRNLYYLDPAGKDLVPDPIFVPVDSGDPAVDLVRALLIPPQGWLAGAVLSAFPPAATLRRPVEILPGSKTAVVDLSLPKSATSTTSLAAMASQLVWTLTSSSYGSASIQAVKLEVNGRLWTPPGPDSAVISPRTYPQPALEPPGTRSCISSATTARPACFAPRAGQQRGTGPGGNRPGPADQHRRLAGPALPGRHRGITRRVDAVHEFPVRGGEAARQPGRAGAAEPDERGVDRVS